MKCNLCACTEFIDFNNRPEALCKNCGSLERTRLLWLFLQQTKINKDTNILHIAPEKGIYDNLTSMTDFARQICCRRSRSVTIQFYRPRFKNRSLRFRTLGIGAIWSDYSFPCNGTYSMQYRIFSVSSTQNAQDWWSSYMHHSILGWEIRWMLPRYRWRWTEATIWTGWPCTKIRQRGYSHAFGKSIEYPLRLQCTKPLSCGSIERGQYPRKSLGRFSCRHRLDSETTGHKAATDIRRWSTGQARNLNWVWSHWNWKLGQVAQAKKQTLA